MVGSGRFDRRIIGLGGTLVLLAFVCACPSAARAECGDYVIVVRNTDNANPAPDPTPMPVGPKCHGPLCSGTPSSAASLPAPRAVERPGLDLAAIATRPNPAPPAVIWPVVRIRVETSISRSDIFHPPRAV